VLACTIRLAPLATNIEVVIFENPVAGRSRNQQRSGRYHQENTTWVHSAREELASASITALVSLQKLPAQKSR
jgi:hypothetical protein